MSARLVGCLVPAVVCLAACAAAPRVTTPAVPRPAAPMPAAPHADPDGDWRVLEAVPFGTSLHAVPFTLHEVLLFHDAARDSADPRDCYGIDAAPPRFLGAPVENYVLCFERDRLIRIDATVSLAPAEAAAIFEGACRRWLDQVAPGTSAQTPDRCEGRDQGVAFDARLSDGADEPAGRVSMTLNAVAPP